MTRNSSRRRLGCLVSLLCMSGFALLGAACSGASITTEPPDEHLATAVSNLDGDQCTFFDVNGHVQICHHTSSTSHPFTIIKTSVQGCINGHAGHAQDYVAVGDPTCQGGGCLPVTAPCDATLPCCDGLSCQSGTCQVVDPCAGVVCGPLPGGSDPQCASMVCDPATGQCMFDVFPGGTSCITDEDGDTGTCNNGACQGLCANVVCITVVPPGVDPQCAGEAQCVQAGSTTFCEQLPPFGGPCTASDNCPGTCFSDGQCHASPGCPPV